MTFLHVNSQKELTGDCNSIIISTIELAPLGVDGLQAGGNKGGHQARARWLRMMTSDKMTSVARQMCNTWNA